MKSATRIIYVVALASLLTITHGQALADAKADAERRAQHIEERFNAADKNHDGKLTRAEAESMPRIAKNFDKIDKDKKGYVTVDQVRAFAMETP